MSKFRVIYVCLKCYMNRLTLKMMHCLSEIQISLRVLNFIWQPYPSPCLQQWARPPQGEFLFRPLWIFSRLETLVHQMCFNNFGDKSEGLILFLGGSSSGAFFSIYPPRPLGEEFLPNYKGTRWNLSGRQWFLWFSYLHNPEGLLKQFLPAGPLGPRQLFTSIQMEMHLANASFSSP